MHSGASFLIGSCCGRWRGSPTARCLGRRGWYAASHRDTAATRLSIPGRREWVGSSSPPPTAPRSIAIETRSPAAKAIDAAKPAWQEDLPLPGARDRGRWGAWALVYQAEDIKLG